MIYQSLPLHLGEMIAPTFTPARVAHLAQNLKVTKGNRKTAFHGEVCYLRKRGDFALNQQSSLRAKRSNPVATAGLDCFALLVGDGSLCSTSSHHAPTPFASLRLRANQSDPAAHGARRSIGGKAHPLPLPQAGGEIITLPQPCFYQRRQIGLWAGAEV